MRYRKRLQIVLAGLVLLGVYVAPAIAQDKASMKRQAQSQMATQAPFHPELQVLDINNMTTWVRNNGKFDYVDPWSHVNGTFPKATTGAVFAQGVVWGGKVDDGSTPELRVNGSTYASGMRPGPVERAADGSVIGPASYDRASHHVWRVRRTLNSEDAETAAAYYLGKSQEDVTDDEAQQFMDQYEYDRNNWPAHLGAPYDDVNGNGQYDADVDQPGYPGADQTVWFVTNDLGGISEESYGSPAIGIEQQTTIWAYDFPGTSPLGNISFMQTRLIYTGTPDTPDDASIDSMFVVMWADPDVGTYSNDFAGADTALSLGYAYNASPQDDSYQNFGLAPAAVGWDFLQGPVNQEGDTLGMTSFVYFAAGSEITDPTLGSYDGTQEWFNLMRGVRPQPKYPATTPFVNPLTGQETQFTLTGDPVTRSGWVDGAQLPPGDRRVVLSTGPFQVQKGDTVDVVVGQIGGLGQSNLSSVTVLKFYDEFAQFAYDNDFQLPSPAPVPPVRATSLNDQVVLNWGFDHEENARTESWNQRGFEFEGYNVYQLPSATASISEGERIATFDKQNFISVVQDRVIDEETGFVVEKPVITSDDAGLQRFIALERDELRNRPIANGVTYHYAITTYSVLTDDDAEAPFRYLESTATRRSVTPSPVQPGVTGVPNQGQSLAVEQAAGTGDATISATVVDPAQVREASYAITFDSTGGASWNLLRGGEQVLSNQPMGALTDIPLIDGVQVNVSDVTFSVPTTILDDSTVVGDGLSLWGDATLFGAPAGYYSEFTGQPPPTAEQAMPDLEFRFTGNGAMEAPTTEGGQLASYWERAAFGLTDMSEFESDVIRMPFELWDIENDRQINFAVVGRNVDGESPWGDGVGDYYRMAARDYIVPIMTEYDEGAVQSNGTNPAAPENTWLLFFEEGGASEWETGDVYRVHFANPINPDEDRFVFDTDAAVTGVDTLLTQRVEDINVFPNPYRGFSRLESNRFEKFMTFTHLPESATIRIFNLAGIMVRVLEHDNPNSQYERWDLNNQDGIPVASGIYIAHVETDHGEKVLKLAVVQEQQILQRY